MDSIAENTRVKYYFAKYKYVLIVVAAGILLMMLPAKESNVEAAPIPNASQITPDMQTQLEDILSHISGVGKVSVLLTQSEGQRILYEANEDRTDTEQSSTNRKDTVIIVDEMRTESGLVQQIIPPVYLGAIIVCQGGDNASVRLAVVDAVANATGLTSDRISVLKMK